MSTSENQKTHQEALDIIRNLKTELADARKALEFIRQAAVSAELDAEREVVDEELSGNDFKLRDAKLKRAAITSLALTLRVNVDIAALKAKGGA